MNTLMRVALLTSGCLLVGVAALGQQTGDNLIVPGQRVGPVFIGMSASELYRAMGEPDSTHNDGTWVEYQYKDLGTLVRNDQKVWTVWVQPNSPRYGTAEGTRIGAPDLPIRARQPPDYVCRGPDPRSTNFCYSSGLFVRVRNGAVEYISIFPKEDGCSRYCNNG